jgi:dihydropteroate synthase
VSRRPLIGSWHAGCVPQPTDLVLGPVRLRPAEMAVMAIVNRTPDSFYDGGSNLDLADACDAVRRAVDEGAVIVDIGGVRAGSVGARVDEAEELARVLPVVEFARSTFPELAISVDTWRSGVARAAATAGADLVNDTWQGADQDVVAVAADTGLGLVCSHTGGLPPRTDPDQVDYDDVVADVVATVTAAAERAVAAGVRADGILVDPTHDFGKTTYHSLELTSRLDELVATGWPVLVALSRKDFVGETLGLPARDRLEGTLAATAISAWLGTRVFRAHDVQATRRVLDMVASIVGTRPPSAASRGLG